jgi:hypothetical protein
LTDRTPIWDYYLEIPEVLLFTDQEKFVLKKAMTELQRFTIDDAWAITRFRLWAATQAELNDARVRLGKVVIQIINDRQNTQHGSGTSGNL